MSMRCPACDGEMQIVHVKCRDCDTEVMGAHIKVSRLVFLTPVQTEFVEVFLKYGGSRVTSGQALGCSYPTVMHRLAEVQAVLYSHSYSEDYPTLVDLASDELPEKIQDEAPVVLTSVPPRQLEG